jgi:trehalose 6-phosphate phosphatase
MTEALAPDMEPTLKALAAPGTLVVLDFDGTLAPVVADRDAARPTRRSMAVLRDLAEHYPVAILSGRSAPDVKARLDGAPVRWFVGSHGAEWPGERGRSRAWRRLVASWRSTLSKRLARVPGVDIESKPLSLAVHYRRSPAPRRASAAIVEAIGDLPGAVSIPGKRVWNLVPAGAGDKGTALQRLVRDSGARRVLFVGDDVTDEAAFAADLGVPSVMVRVGRSRGTRAPHWVKRRADVDLLLERLVAYARGRRAAPGPDPTGEALGPVLGFMRDLWALEQGLNHRSRAMLSRRGLTGPQRLVLRVVGRLGAVSPAQLARVLCLHRSSVSRLVWTLELRGYLRLRPHPARRSGLLLRLTPRGEEVARQSTGTVESAIASVLAAAPEADVAATRRLIRSISRQLLVSGGGTDPAGSGASPSRPRRARPPPRKARAPGTGAASPARRTRS